MINKLVFVLLCLAAARSAATDTHNPTNSASSYSSINNNLVPKTPAPIYEENDINKHRDTSKISPFSNEKYAQISNNGAFLTQPYSYPSVYSSPIHTPVYYNPTSYSVATPVLTKTYSEAGPIYTQSHGIPVLTKTPGLLTYSHAPVVQDHGLKTITYSEAPLVSHMTFTGLGTNYAW